MTRMSWCFLPAAFLALLVLLPSPATSSVGDLQNVHASGKGIVAPGANLTLTYEVGHQWDECFWYWYEFPNEYFYCSFEQAETTREVSLHRCNSEEMRNDLVYTGSNKSECTITVLSVTDADNCSWAVRLDSDMNVKVLDIIVASAIDNVTLSVGVNDTGYVQAGEVGPIGCRIAGGRPAPLISLDVGNVTRNSSGTQTNTPDDQGIFTSIEELLIAPTIDDLGKPIKCSAMLLDGDNKLLFDMVTAEDVLLNVTFPPQTVANQTVKVKAGLDAVASFTFLSNPAPSSAEWRIRAKPQLARAENTNDVKEEEQREDREASALVTVSPGHTDDKYVASGIIAMGQPGKPATEFKLNLIIDQAQQIDAEKLYSLHVENVFGAAEFFFELRIEEIPITTAAPNVTVAPTTAATTTQSSGANTTSTTAAGGGSANATTESSGGDGDGGDAAIVSGNGSIVGVVVALLLITGLIAGSVCIYKKRYMRNATTPLSTREGRP